MNFLHELTSKTNHLRGKVNHVFIMLMFSAIICFVAGCKPKKGAFVEMVHNESFDKNRYSIEEVVDQEFVTEYLSKYTLKNLIEALYKVDESTSVINGVVEKTLEFSGKTEKIDFSWSEIDALKEASGYYAGESDHTEEEKVTGGFNRGKDNEPYYETKSRYNEVFFRGDWMVNYAHGDNYYKGRYEWSGGKFYDEPAKWIPYSTVFIYYKGHQVYDYDGIMDSIGSVRFSIYVFSEKGKEGIVYYGGFSDKQYLVGYVHEL